MASLYETFPAAEARRIAKRLEFHHTPKHGSWLNMAEIEFSVLARACLRGRNGDEDSLERAVSACVSERNAIGATINWRFTAQDARRNLPSPLSLPILIWFSTRATHHSVRELTIRPAITAVGTPTTIAQVCLNIVLFMSVSRFHRDLLRALPSVFLPTLSVLVP